MPEDDQSKWVGVRPTNPAENIPVTESAPLTDILVAPSAGAPEFLTRTEKRLPAIADLQAIESFVRVYDRDVNVGAPNYNQDAYTVPAGKIFYQNMIVAWCEQADPTVIEIQVRSGITNYLYYSAPYGAANERHLFVSPLILNEGEICRVRWTGTLATTDTVVLVFGHIIDKY